MKEQFERMRTLTLGDSNVLKQQDDSRDRELGRNRRDEVRVDDWRPDMLEASRDGLQDLDRVLARRALPVSAVEP